jgi:cytochrome b561
MYRLSYSKIYRTLHWAIAISFVLLLITIFLRMTWMNKFHVSDILQENLTERGITLTEEETILIAKKIRKPMWQWHIYIGYVLVGLFAIRFLLPFMGEMPFQNPIAKGLSGKEKFHYWIYIVFYILVTISLTTGLLIEFGPKVYKKDLELVHIQSIYYLVGYIVLHLAGVLFEEVFKKSGIVSRIIGGKNL